MVAQSVGGVALKVADWSRRLNVTHSPNGVRKFFPASRPLRAIASAEFHALFGKTLLHFDNVRAVAGLDGAEDVHPGKIRAGKSAVVDDLSHVRAGVG